MILNKGMSFDATGSKTVLTKLKTAFQGTNAKIYFYLVPPCSLTDAKCWTSEDLQRLHSKQRRKSNCSRNTCHSLPWSESSKSQNSRETRESHRAKSLGHRNILVN